MQSWLYDISERINSLVAVLDEWDDESIAGDVKNAIAAIYESDVPAAVADGIEYIKKQTAYIEAIDKRLDELKALKQARKNRQVPLSLDEVIAPDLVCSQDLRAFFQQHLGPDFRFKVEFQDWLHRNAGLTFRDAVEAYKQFVQI